MMLLSQHPLFTLSPAETIFLLGLLIAICLIYLLLQITAFVLLKGRWKLFAFPGVTFPITLLLIFFGNPNWPKINLWIIGFAGGLYLVPLDIYLVFGRQTRASHSSEKNTK